MLTSRRVLILAAMCLLPALLMGCRENRVPNGVVSEAVDEMKLAGLAKTDDVRREHLSRAIDAFERVLSEYPQSRPARFLREGGKFNGMTVEDLKQRRDALSAKP